MTKTVCVVGAGLSGISAVKSCLEEGLQPTCYEARSDLGGNWNYRKSEQLKRSRVYDSLITNVSKEASCFSDFPYPKNYPPYFSHTKVLEYLQSYVKHFDLERHIMYNMTVEKLEQTQSEGYDILKWKVTTRDFETGKMKTEVYDCVLICNGVDSKPRMPNIKGLNDGTFKGKVMHSCEYDSPAEFQDKNVVVIGLGNSGGDIVVDVSRQAKTAIMSSRSGAWIIPRQFEGGLPPDMTATTRLKSFLGALMPGFLRNWLATRLINARVNHDTIGVRSKYGPICTAASFLVNDELPARIFSGKVKIKPDVKRLNEDEIIFSDGSKAKVDVVICATGYGSEFPFISDDILPNDRSKVRLFEWMVPFDIPNPESLAVIGFLPPAGGSSFPEVECQTRYITQVMSGMRKLPPVPEMRKKFEEMRKTFQGHGESFRFRDKMGIERLDRIAILGGFYPSFWQLFFRDPKLAIAVYAGPFMSYHYRLVGRHTWSGARNRILNAIQNTMSGLHSIHEGKND